MSTQVEPSENIMDPVEITAEVTHGAFKIVNKASGFRLRPETDGSGTDIVASVDYGHPRYKVMCPHRITSLTAQLISPLTISGSSRVMVRTTKSSTSTLCTSRLLTSRAVTSHLPIPRRPGASLCLLPYAGIWCALWGRLRERRCCSRKILSVMRTSMLSSSVLPRCNAALLNEGGQHRRC